MSVVAKMQCHRNEGPASLGDGETGVSMASIRLGAVYEGAPDKQAASENAIFGRYTPYGEVNLGIANPAAAAFFKVGKKYYVRFEEAPD